MFENMLWYVKPNKKLHWHQTVLNAYLSGYQDKELSQTSFLCLYPTTHNQWWETVTPTTNQMAASFGFGKKFAFSTTFHNQWCHTEKYTLPVEFPSTVL